MKSKSKVYQIFASFFCLVQNQFVKIIKRIRLDNDKEYVNHESSKFVFDNGIIHEY